MKLCAKDLENRKEWEEKGYCLPEFDRELVKKKTAAEPVWIHFGAGNLFRAFHANLAQRMLNAGLTDKGVLVAEGFDYEIVEKQYRPYGHYSLLVTLKCDGSVDKTVIGSITESCILDSEKEEEFGRLKDIFMADSLQMVTFTITEKGYGLVNGKGELLPAVAADYQNGPGKPESYMGKVTALLYARYRSGQKPIAMLSTDNCSHNGDKLYQAVYAFADNWQKNGLAEKGFLDYIKDRTKVSFPWSMIDKITPRPDVAVQAMLEQDGLSDMEPVVTSKNTYIAPFVNAEETEYLVVEDVFPNGRPPLEKVGVIFTERETVDKVERMKVCTCLNPLHTAMSIYGCLLGYTKISEEMKDAEIVHLIETIGYKEGLPVVTNPGVIDPKQFIDTVVQVRLPNPFMPDAPQRIATDTSQKLAIRFGETIKNYRKEGKDLHQLKIIPLVFAGWIRYLMAVDDNGQPMELSPDPLLDTVRPYVFDWRLGEVSDPEKSIRPLLENEQIFGVNLYEAGMADLVCSYLKELLAGPGAVREVLKRYL